MKIIDTYESLDQWLKVLLQIFFGAYIGGVYRLLRYTESQNTTTLVVGILFIATGVGNLIAWVIDLYSEIKFNRITILVD